MDSPGHPLPVGTDVILAGRSAKVERRAGTDERPIVRLSGLGGRSAASGLRGETLLVEGRLEPDEWLARDLVGCRVEGLGDVRRVLAGPSCELLELEDGTLVPFVSDAIRAVDTDTGTIRVDHRFLVAGSQGPGGPTPTP